MAEVGSSPEAFRFYKQVLERLGAEGVPYLIGGAGALGHYTGVYRDTKDLDLFISEESLPTAFESLKAIGLEGEMIDPRWIAKLSRGEYYVDFIFNSYHEKLPVDESWIGAGRSGDFAGVAARFISPEHLILTKSYMMHRNRFDGADINHLILRAALDWELLLRLFEPYPELLHAYLLQFRFVYPGETGRIPAEVGQRLAARTSRWPDKGDEKLCRGELVSRYDEPQYEIDYEQWGYRRP